jgi:hypothetical protein
MSTTNGRDLHAVIFGTLAERSWEQAGKAKTPVQSSIPVDLRRGRLPVLPALDTAQPPLEAWLDDDPSNSSRTTRLKEMITGLQAHARGYLVRQRWLAGLGRILDTSFGMGFVNQLVATWLDTEIVPDVLLAVFRGEVRSSCHGVLDTTYTQSLG